MSDEVFVIGPAYLFRLAYCSLLPALSLPCPETWHRAVGSLRRILVRSPTPALSRPPTGGVVLAYPCPSPLVSWGALLSTVRWCCLRLLWCCHLAALHPSASRSPPLVPYHMVNVRLLVASLLPQYTNRAPLLVLTRVFHPPPTPRVRTFLPLLLPQPQPASCCVSASPLRPSAHGVGLSSLSSTLARILSSSAWPPPLLRPALCALHPTTLSP